MALIPHRPGPPRFLETYEDAFLGTLHARDEVVRDLDNRIRRRDDLGQVDRDHLLESWSIRTERPADPVPE